MDARADLSCIIVAGDTSQAARIISMVTEAARPTRSRADDRLLQALSILITVLTLQLFTRQLQGELSFSI